MDSKNPHAKYILHIIRYKWLFAFTTTPYIYQDFWIETFIVEDIAVDSFPSVDGPAEFLQEGGMLAGCIQPPLAFIKQP